SGGTNTWGEITVDEKRGIAYFPTGSPTYDYYGADRIGSNLFANCLLALDARTGKRLPAAIARAAMAKGRQCTEQDVVDFLINAHSASINNTFVVTDCHQAIKDLRAKELTYGGGNTTEARF